MLLANSDHSQHELSSADQQKSKQRTLLDTIKQRVCSAFTKPRYLLAAILMLLVVAAGMFYLAQINSPTAQSSGPQVSPTVIHSEPTTPASTPSATSEIATDTVYGMGVLVLKYFPLSADGKYIDIAVTGDVGDPYATIRQHTTDLTDNLKVAIEKSTRYLGYKDPNAKNALTYHIVDTKEYARAVPIKARPDAPTYPDYNQILSEHKICDYVDTRDVREVWIWAYQGPDKPETGHPYLGISESKMSGPHGDISNSYRYNDMPVCEHTYTVYTFNYQRGTAEALHSWGHQVEAELTAVDANLFRTLFQGSVHPQTLGQQGRCGSVHNPPNARNEYDWANTTPQLSDCLDWQPDGTGKATPISCTTWGCEDVSDTDNPQLDWMIWMWQNLPGRSNAKTYGGKQLRNWWDVHGAFDKVMAGQEGLTVP